MFLIKSILSIFKSNKPKLKTQEATRPKWLIKELNLWLPGYGVLKFLSLAAAFSSQPADRENGVAHAGWGWVEVQDSDHYKG